MSIRKIPLVIGEYYHIYNRGNSKQDIFHDTDDYHRFLSLLFLLNRQENFKIEFLKNTDPYTFPKTSRLVSIGAYCLMPNHFHILLSEMQAGFISKFMQKLTTGYSMYYNKKYKRTGSLFEGKFKSQHAHDDKYLKYLFSYIHLNPVKLIQSDWKENRIKNHPSITAFLKTYGYSSYLDYMGVDRPQSVILDYESFPNYFSNKLEFEQEIFTWLHYGE